MSNQPSQMSLTVQTGSQAGQIFQLNAGSQTIGRTGNNQIIITDPTISKQHAQITVQPEGVWIQDMGSSNGTFVNGQRITTSTWLKPGDSIQVGTSVVMGIQGIGGAALSQAASGSGAGWLVGGLITVIGLLLLAGIGFGAWYLWGQNATSTQATVTSVSQPVATEETQPDTPTPEPVPEVTIEFTTNKTTVQLGECVTLRWNVSEAKEVRLDGELILATGERKVCPQEASKTYRLTALTFEGETKEEALTLTVPPTPPPPPGVEIDFRADETTVTYGNCTTLHWNVVNVQAVRLDGEKVGPQGTKEVCPTDAANTYQLLVAPLNGDLIEQNVIINVPATPAPTATPEPTTAPPASQSQGQGQTPVIDKLIADQTMLNQGSCTTLRWTVRNAQSVQISGGEIGSQNVSNQGARRVCPPGVSTTYTLIASGSGGTVQASVTLGIIAPTATPVIVIVTQPPPAIPAGPPSISVCAKPKGDCWKYYWTIDNVKEVYFNGKGVTGHGNGEGCSFFPEATLRIVHTNGSVEKINNWPACN